MIKGGPRGWYITGFRPRQVFTLAWRENPVKILFIWVKAKHLFRILLEDLWVSSSNDFIWFSFVKNGNSRRLPDTCRDAVNAARLSLLILFCMVKTCFSQLLFLGKWTKVRSGATSFVKYFSNRTALPKPTYRSTTLCQEQLIFLHKLTVRKIKHQMPIVLVSVALSLDFWRIRINQKKLSQKGESLSKSKLWIGSKYKQLFTISHLSVLRFEQFFFHLSAQQKTADQLFIKPHSKHFWVNRSACTSLIGYFIFSKSFVIATLWKYPRWSAKLPHVQWLLFWS